jgi:hypothetical protein
MRPAWSRTLRCFEMAGADTGKPAPSWETEQGPRVSLTTISCLMGSANALNIALTEQSSPLPAKVDGASYARGASTISGLKLTAAARNSAFSCSGIFNLSSVLTA